MEKRIFFRLLSVNVNFYVKKKKDADDKEVGLGILLRISQVGFIRKSLHRALNLVLFALFLISQFNSHIVNNQTGLNPCSCKLFVVERYFSHIGLPLRAEAIKVVKISFKLFS